MTWKEEFKKTFPLHYETREKIMKFIENLLKEAKKRWETKNLKNQNQGKLL